ncbi:MAG: proline dehydrogenase family protein [Halobacteriaceae archaeon]
MIPPVANRFVAGETAAEAIEYAQRCDEEGVGVLLNRLGEHYREPGPAAADTDRYVRLVGDLLGTDLDACVSVKPSQLGLRVGEPTFEANLDRVLSHAVPAGVFVWLDMEDHETTDATLDAYERFAREHGGGVGVCVQANLRRTRDDLERLADLPGKVRLVKGAYDEPADVAYRRKDEVNRAYEADLEFMFEAFDDGVAVGSHDPEMIRLARDLHDEHGTPFEFQMLMGVREDAQRELAADYDVYRYVPYGPNWLAYFSRRVAERKENALFALRAILGR